MEPSLRRSQRSWSRHPLTTESFINFANICSDSRAPTTIRTDASLCLFSKSAVSLEGSMVSPRPGERSGDQLSAEPGALTIWGDSHSGFERYAGTHDGVRVSRSKTVTRDAVVRF